MKRKTNWWVPVFGLSTLLAGSARGEIQKIPKDAVVKPVSNRPVERTGADRPTPPPASSNKDWTVPTSSAPATGAPVKNSILPVSPGGPPGRPPRARAPHQRWTR